MHLLELIVATLVLSRKLRQNRHTGKSRYPGISDVTKHWTPGFTGVTTFYDHS